MFRNLGQFIKALSEAGEIRRIRTPVSPLVEISRLTDRESKSPGGGKALFFETVTGSPFPAATNLFGSHRRICMALGVGHLDELGSRIRRYIDINPPQNLQDALGILPLAFGAVRFFPRRVRTGTPPCQQVVYRGKDVDISRLPVLQCWPKDAGRFITLPLVITRHPVTGRGNMGMYRMQVFDRRTTGMHWHVHKDGSHYYGEYARRGRRMPVAVAIGADPATIYAATAPMPRGIDELILAGFIRNRTVPMARCLTVDLDVPAESEFVLEGYVDPGELRREGPFGDHTGYYSPADDYPVFHVTALTHRKKPVYTATLVGRPPMEDCYLALATERLFLPLLQTVMPEIRDYWFPWEGVFHNIVVVAIEKAYAGHAQKICSGLWGQGQMSFCKAIVVVDATVDPRNTDALFALLVGRFDPETDMTVTTGILDVLDHAAPYPSYGGKIGIDLTDRFPGEPPRSPRPLKERGTVPVADLNERVRVIVPGTVSCRPLLDAQAETETVVNRLLALAVDRSPEGGRDHPGAALLSAAALSDTTIFLLFDRHIDLSDPSLMMWTLFNNVDPRRDVITAGGRVVVDARAKGAADGHPRPWPEALTFDA